MSSYIPRKFFRMMRNEDLQNEEIRVPKKFVKLHWKSVSNPVVFIFPNGATQKIHWVKRNGDIWFQKNWEKFAQFLEFRYKVNFEYIGGSYFKIEIYGLNTLEIDYSKIKFIDEVNAAENRNEVEEAIEVSDDSDKSLDESEIPTQTQRTKNGKRKMTMDYNANQQNISCGNRGDMNKKAKKCSTSKTNNGRGRKRGCMIKEITRNYHSSGENPSFVLQLSPSYAHGRCLRIPNDFSREHLKGCNGNVKIRFGKDKPMEVKLIIDTNGSSIITTGWNLFAEKYNLKAGDNCKFELTQSQPFLFTVTINPWPAIKPSYRGRSSTHDNNIGVKKHNIKGTSNRRAISDSKGRNAIKHDTFKLTVNSSLYPYVPNAFLHRHKECCEKFVELKVDGKSWFVKVKYYPRGSRFSIGWPEFKEECRLEIGDRCCFKLIDEEKFVFEVSFERKK